MSLLPLYIALGGVVISILVGTLWYSPGSPMGKVHMQYLGFDKLSKAEQLKAIEKAKPGMPKVYGAQMVLSFLTSFAVAFIMVMSIQNGLTAGMAYGFIALNWLCFVMPVVGGGILWANVDRGLAWKKFFSDSANHLVNMSLVALLASFFA